MPHRPFAAWGGGGRDPLGPDDALVADGQVLRTRSGAEVTLRGTNLGGWLLHEPWMSPGGAPSLDRGGWRVRSSTGSADAVLGDDEQVWRPQPDAGGPHWVEADLGERRTFDSVSMVIGGGHLTTVVVTISTDGAEWKPFGSATTEGGLVVVRGDYRDARHVRVTFEGAPNSLAVSALRVHCGDAFNVRRALEDRFGEAVTQRLMRAYEDTWITAADLDHVADLGLNLVRIPLHWQVLMHTDGTMRPDDESFHAIDRVIDGASARGMYAMIDLHGAPGGASPWNSSGQAGSNRLWTDDDAQERTERTWRRIAERYVGVPGLAGYDLLNEPQVGDGSTETPTQIRQKFDVYDRLYRVIRAVDPDHAIFVNAFPSLEVSPPPETYGWTNVVYETHHFDFEHTHDREGLARFVRAGVESLATYRRAWGIPMFAGEFWFAGYPDLFDTFVTELESIGVSWANWAYKTKTRPAADDRNVFDHGCNWSLFAEGPDAIPDLDRDDAETIEAKWRRYDTSQFLPNLELATALVRPPSGDPSTGRER